SVILRILSQIGIVGYRFLNPLNQTWALDPNALVQFILKGRVTRGGHGEFSHRFLPSIRADRDRILLGRVWSHQSYSALTLRHRPCADLENLGTTPFLDLGIRCTGSRQVHG